MIAGKGLKSLFWVWFGFKKNNSKCLRVKGVGACFLLTLRPLAIPLNAIYQILVWSSISIFLFLENWQLVIFMTFKSSQNCTFGFMWPCCHGLMDYVSEGVWYHLKLNKIWMTSRELLIKKIIILTRPAQ